MQEIINNISQAINTENDEQLYNILENCSEIEINEIINQFNKNKNLQTKFYSQLVQGIFLNKCKDEQVKIFDKFLNDKYFIDNIMRQTYKNDFLNQDYNTTSKERLEIISKIIIQIFKYISKIETCNLPILQNNSVEITYVLIYNNFVINSDILIKLIAILKEKNFYDKYAFRHFQEEQIQSQPNYCNISYYDLACCYNLEGEYRHLVTFCNFQIIQNMFSNKSTNEQVQIFSELLNQKICMPNNINNIITNGLLKFIDFKSTNQTKIKLINNFILNNLQYTFTNYNENITAEDRNIFINQLIDTNFLSQQTMLTNIIDIFEEKSIEDKSYFLLCESIYKNKGLLNNEYQQKITKLLINFILTDNLCMEKEFVDLKISFLNEINTTNSIYNTDQINEIKEIVLEKQETYKQTQIIINKIQQLKERILELKKQETQKMVNIWYEQLEDGVPVSQIKDYDRVSKTDIKKIKANKKQEQKAVKQIQQKNPKKHPIKKQQTAEEREKEQCQMELEQLYLQLNNLSNTNNIIVTKHKKIILASEFENSTDMSINDEI